MKVEHVIWEVPESDASGFGLLEVDIHYHGGGMDRVLLEGSFKSVQDGMLTRTVVTVRVLNTVLDENEMAGVSAIYINRVGTIVE